tara:strand:+ start:29766 stop:30533 length:768 start_codon:yes stop_codon:yes gene_type:complete
MYIIKRFILVLILIVPLNTLAETITIRADEWFPINGEPKSEKPGYMIEIANLIASKHGANIDYKTMPWLRSLSKVREGNFDCVVGAFTDDAPDFIFPQEEWGIIESTFYVKKGSKWRYEGVESLKSIKIGSIGGYAYGDDLDAYIEANKSSSAVQVVNANNALEQNIKKLQAGRVDAVIEAHLVMNAKLKDMGISQDEFISAGLLGEANKMYIACSPAKESSKKYTKWFSEGIQMLRDSGKLQAILDKYGLKDWK